MLYSSREAASYRDWASAINVVIARDWKSPIEFQPPALLPVSLRGSFEKPTKGDPMWSGYLVDAEVVEVLKVQGIPEYGYPDGPVQAPSPGSNPERQK